MKKVAILVDGGFYRKISKYLWGDKSPEQRADELIRYCRCHLKDRDSYYIDGDKKKYQSVIRVKESENGDYTKTISIIPLW